MLTPEKKEQIKHEEIFREEVRRELTGPSSRVGRFIGFLNSPLGIYFLSTVLIGLLSFGFTRWQAAKEHQIAAEEQLRKVSVEISFRIRQMDDALSRAEAATTIAQSRGSSITIQQVNITYNRLPVVVRLGGLGEIPGEQVGIDWVRFRDVDVQVGLLPFRQGYKDKEFAYSDLQDLTEEAWRLRTRDIVPRGLTIALRRRLDQLDDPAYDLLSFVLRRSSVEYASGSDTIRDPQKLAEAGAPLLDRLRSAWTQVRSDSLLAGLAR
jgi:hypothetical protein